MTDNIFRFHFLSDNNTYFHVGSNGVSESPVKTWVDSCVDGWQDAQVAFKRSENYWGAFREYSLPVKFVKDGAKILRYVVYTKGFTGTCIVLIEKLNRSSRQYEYWYDGYADFSQMDDQEDYFSVTLLERGLVGIIKNREDVEYEIPLVGSDLITGNLDGVKLGSRSSWILGDSIKDDPDFPALEHFNTGMLPLAGESFMTTPVGNDIQAGSFIIPRDENYHLYGADINNTPFSTAKTTLKTTSKWFNISYTGQLEMRVNLEGHENLVGTRTYKVEIYAGVTNASGSRVGSKTVKLGESPIIQDAVWTDFTVSFSGLLGEIDEGSTVSLYTRYVRLTGSSSTITRKSYFFTSNSILHINYQAMVPETQFDGLRYIDLFKRLISKITDGQFTAASTFLSNTDTSSSFRKSNYDNSPYNTIVTSGDGLRFIDGAVIKTSLRDLYKDAWSRWCLCLFLDGNVVRLEPLSYVLSNNILMDVGPIAKPGVKLYTKALFNLINVGYNSYDNSNVEGKNEFNAGLTFLVKDNIVVKNTDDIISPYRADVYGIESTRAETLDKDRMDNRSDNSVFVIEVNPVPNPISGWFSVYRPSGTITGVDDPDGIYNIALSPKRALLRHLPRIRSFIKTGILEFQTTEKNSELSSNIGTGLITETENINLVAETMYGNSVAPLFEPYLLSFDCPPKYNTAEILGLQTAGCIRYSDNGIQRKGFIMDVGVKPATQDKYGFILLSHVDNDMTKFIR